MENVNTNADARAAKLDTLQQMLAEKQEALATAKEEVATAKEEVKQATTNAREDARLQRIQQNEAALAERLGIDVAMLIATDPNGNAERTYENVATVVSNKHRIELNEFSMEEFIDGQKRNKYNELQLLNECSYGLGWRNKDYVNDAISSIAYDNKFHPVKQVVEQLIWDGKQRCEDFFIKRLGAEDTPLTRELTFKWLYAMLKRVYEPGCVFDHYIILADSQQGTGKTKTLERLTMAIGIIATDSTITANLGDKDNIMKLNNAIIGVFDESAATKYSNLETFKSFITNSRYCCRLPYERATSCFESHTVFALTTNDQTFLTDSTSDFERRSWVLQCNGRQRTEAEWEELNNDKELQQVWAELYYYYTHQSEAPYTITGNGCTFLCAEQVEQLKQIQKGCKTSTEDYEVENAIDSVLYGKYSQEIFDTPQQMIDDLTSRCKDKDFACELGIIPIKWVYGAVNKLLRKSRSEQYIRSILQNNDEWVMAERVYYNRKRCTCLKRVVTTTATDMPTFDNITTTNDINNIDWDFGK